MTEETDFQDASPAPSAAPEPAVEPVESDTTPETEQADDAEPERKPSGVQKRIDELTRNWRDEQRRNDELLRMLSTHRSVVEPEPIQAPAPSQRLPSLEEYGYDETKYQAALIEHATRQAETIVERRLREAEQARAEQSRMETFATRQQEFSKSVADFEDKVMRDPTLPISAAMRDVIIDSAEGPAVAYWLAQNRSAAEMISKLPAHLAALEMGRIEGRLSAQRAAAKSAPKVSNAPPPPPKVDASEDPVHNDPENMSIDQWMKWRQKQLSRKR